MKKNTSPKANPVPAYAGSEDDWKRVFKVEIAAIAILERTCWHCSAHQPPPHRQVVIIENRPVFCSSL